jgi:hypothetical protein
MVKSLDDSTDTRPKPERFTEFVLLQDQTGFNIKNCDFTFYFDVNGGWFDEYHNYYDADGQPCTPPEYSEDWEDDKYGGFDDDIDKLTKEYDLGDDGDYEDEHLHKYENIYSNAENNRLLAFYLPDQEIEMEVKNLNYRSTEKEYEEFLAKNKIQCIEFEFCTNDRNQFNGTVYMKLDRANAEKLIEFNGSNYKGRDIKIFVLAPEDHEDVIAGDVPIDVTKIAEITKTEEKKTEEKPKQQDKQKEEQKKNARKI